MAERTDPFEAAGDTWVLDDDKTRYWKSTIAGREQDSFDAWYEYQIGVFVPDGVERKRITFQFRSAFPEARTTDGDPVGSLPDDLPEGIRVQVNSVNVDPDDVLPVLRGLAHRIGLRRRYFRPEYVHEWSRCFSLAKYVRIDRDVSQEKITGLGGILDRLATFGSKKRGKGELTWDNREVEGHRSTVVLDGYTWRKFLGDEHVGKRVKSYHPKYVRRADRDDPLADPKCEVQFSTEYTDDDAVPWAEVSDLADELENTLLSTLDWAGVSLRATEGVYVEDQYFDVTEETQDVTVWEDPLPAIEEREEDLAVGHFTREDATEGERQVLRHLAESGTTHYTELAERTGTSESTVYRAANTFESIIHSAKGRLSFEDDLIREKFQDLFANLEDAMEWVEQGLHDLAADQDGLITEDSPLAKWARRYGAAASRTADGWEFELHGTFDLHQIRKALRSGYVAAREDGSKTAARFMEAGFEWNSPDGRESRERAFTIRGGEIFVLGSTTFIHDG